MLGMSRPKVVCELRNSERGQWRVSMSSAAGGKLREQRMLAAHRLGALGSFSFFSFFSFFAGLAAALVAFLAGFSFAAALGMLHSRKRQRAAGTTTGQLLLSTLSTIAETKNNATIAC